MVGYTRSTRASREAAQRAGTGPRRQTAAEQLRAYMQPQGTGRNSAYTSTYRPDVLDLSKEIGESYGGTLAAYQASQRAAPRAATPPRLPGNSGGRSGGGGGRGYGGGGGGGGGGGISAAAAAQSQIDAMMRLLGSGAYTANAAPYDAMRKSVTDASAADQAAATGAYNGLDTYLQANATNPFANVQLQQAQSAPDMNPYLQSQGVQGTNYQASNPEDGGYGAFQNVLALLGANQQAGNASRQAEAQMARTFTGQQLGAADNAYLAQIAGQQAQAQQALDAEKRNALLQMMALVGQGGKMPDLAQAGIYAPGGNAQDPHGWAAIDAALRAAGQR